MEPATLVVVGANGDLSTLWREFHRVVDQIPKDLLKPNAVSPNAMFFCVQFGRDFQFLRRNGGTCGFNCVANNRVRIATFQIEVKLAAGDPGKIEEIVNQFCLQLHVAFYHLYVFCELWRKFCRVVFQIGRCCQGRCQRRAQLVAQRRKKVILGLACFLGRDFFRFQFPAANLIGDVARDLGISSNVAVGVPQRG